MASSNRIQTQTHAKGSMAELTTSKIPIPPASSSYSQTRPKLSIPKPSSSSLPQSRSRWDSSSSELEEFSRLRMVRSNSSSRKSSKEVSVAGSSSNLPYSLKAPSRYYTAPPGSVPSPRAPQPQHTSPSPSTLGASSWKLGRKLQPETRPKNVLRRKAPSIEQYAEQNRANLRNPMPERSQSDYPRIKEPGMSSIVEDHRPPVDQIQARPQYSTPTPPSSRQPIMEVRPTTAGSSHSRIPKELAGLSTSVNTLNLPPPTPNFTSGSSPSTRYTDSPGMWSRVSTPTSLSSYSPGIIHASRLKQPSPTIFRNQLSRPNLAVTPLFDESKRIGPTTTRLPQRSQTEPIPRILTSGFGVKETKRHDTPEISQTPIHHPRQAEWGSTTADFPAKSENPSNEDIVTPKLEDPSFPKACTLTPRLSPSRPSRKGAEPLNLESSPIIWSNLASSRLPTHRRPGSSSSITRSRSPAIPIASRNVSSDSLQSKGSSRIPTRPTFPSQPEVENRSQLTTPTIKSAKLIRKSSISTKELRNTNEVNQSNLPTAGLTKRLGLFPKKSKSVPEATQATNSDSRSRRCPPAGTGHEGYGKYSQRGRRTSIGSNTSRARSTSTSRSAGNHSISNTHLGHEIDDFLLHRLEPVIINGGGLDRPALTLTQTGQSETSIGSEMSPQITLVQSPESITSPAETAIFDHVDPQLPLEVNRRRSFRNSKLFEDQKSSTQYLLVTESGNSTSRRPSDFSVDSQSELTYEDTRIPPASETKSKNDVKKNKPEKSGRWNFFQRSHPNLRSEKKAKEVLEKTPLLPVAISQRPASRAVAHYALLDNEHIDSDPLEDIMTHAEESPPTGDEIDVANGLGLRSKHGQSVLLPEPPAFLTNNRSEGRPSSPKVFFRTEMQSTESQPKAATQRRRPSRLASIGRIPPVIQSARTQHKPSLQSFSRPFSIGEGPSLTVTAAAKVSTSHIDISKNMPDYLTQLPPNCEEFFSFKPRKSSAISASSVSVDGKNLAAVTAVLPYPGSKLTDDEIWHEYDDFLDKVTSPQTPEDDIQHTPRSFNLATRASKILQEGLSGPKDASPPISPMQVQHPESSTPKLSEHNSVHLSRSMILSALHSSVTPSEPMSLGELLSAYTESKGSSTDFTDTDIPCTSLMHDEGMGHAQKIKYIQMDSSFPPAGEENEGNDLIAQANVRSGSLMTSRWLSFGRVLFSPAKNHMQPQDQARVLVIDGLGNDDWSFYCALTYPSAIVYNLTSTAQPQSAPNNPAAWDPPANHRTIHRSGFKTPFPFPKGFFTVAVMRFPAACPETAYDTAISECKRVLRPGGYLELSVMDLDMVNMGSRTRKAVRMLKERIYTRDPNICLKPASDNIQRLLGKRGFANLNRCMVVVPVAGTIVQSSDTSSSSQSIANVPGNYHPRWTGLPLNAKHDRPPSDEDANLSLGDLLSDPSPSPSNDESIAKMVAKVARWWHTRCYELAVFSDNPNKDIWADKKLLRECRRRGTGFRLLIAYAQNPSEVTRRTASV